MAPQKRKNQVSKESLSTEARRVKFFMLRNQGYPKVQACTLCGFTRRQASRLHKKAISQGSLRDLPRSGRPKVYTDAVFERCLDLFKAEEPEDKWTTNKFFNKLKADGVLHSTSQKHTFLEKWKIWLKGRHQHIDYYSTKEEFQILERDKRPRMDYAKTMMQMMEKYPDMQLVFLDETSMEHGQHPKTGRLNFLIG